MTKQLKTLTIDTEETLKKIIDLIFEKVIFMQLIKIVSNYKNVLFIL